MYSALPTTYGKKLPVLSLLFTFLMIGWVSVGWGQVNGDFRTASSGSWNVTTTWQIFNGSSWVATTAGQLPSSGNAVYIQSGHTVTLTQNEACNDLNIANSTTSSIASSNPGKIALSNFTLSVNGKLRTYYGQVNIIPGTYNNNGFPVYPFTSSGGKLSIVGSTRTILTMGEWGATISDPTTGSFPLEINLTSGNTATFQTNVKLTSFNMLTGTLSMATMFIDNGITGQGNATIGIGSTVVSSISSGNAFQRNGSTSAGTLIVNGTLEFTGQTPQIAMNSIFFNGIVRYSKNGAQNLAAATNSGASPSIYTNLELAGSGIKTTIPSLNTIIKSTLLLQGSATVSLGSSATISYSNGSALEYAGSVAQTTSNTEWPSTNAPDNIIINNSLGVTLNTVQTINSSLTLTAGVFSIGTNTLTLQGSLNRTAGNINASSGTVIFNGVTAQTMPASTFSGNVANLQILNTTGVTINQSIAVTGALTVNGLLSPAQSVVISGAGTLSGTGTVQVTAINHTAGDFGTQYTINNKTLTNLEVEYTGSNTQYADGITYGFLKITNLSGVSLAGNATVNRTYKPNTGSLSTAGKKLTLVGTIASSNGTIDASTGEVIFGGTGAQTIPSGLFTGIISNLTINNNSGVTTSSAITTSSLTLNAGTLSIGSSNLTITAAVSRTNGTIDASAGTLIFTNGIAISIPPSTFTNAIQNLTINSSSSVALNSSLTINGALTLASGSLDINDQTLTLIGSVVNSSGDLKGSNKSGLILSGLTPVTLNFNNSFNVLRNLTISTAANVTLGSALRITSDTSLGSAGVVLVSGNLNTGGYKLTLKSSTSGTASVGTSTGTITGDITVERQIPDNGHREWRLLTAPVTGTTIKASWQENANPGGTNNPNPGFGTLITGPGQGSSATAAANGYDFWPAIANSSSSIRQYAGTPTSGSWVSIPSIKNLDISTYPAYLLFVRGDRSIYAAGTNTNATILQATGTLKQGTQSFTLYGSSVQGYTLVGNPYACAIDFDKILIRNATNLLPQFWRWDAQSGSYGGYTLVKKSGTTYYTVPSPFTGNGTATATQQYIESGQGFFVQPASGVTNNASFDIQEADKVINTTTTSPFRIKPPVEARLFINLNQYYSADSIVLSDGVLASFVNTADTTQNVAKPFNFNENLGISRGTSVLTVEAHKPVTSTDTIRLTLWNTTQRNYQLQLKADNWKTAVHAYLLDNYLKTSTPVNLKGNITTLNFAVDGTAASAAQDRFMVVFNTTAAAPLLARKLQTGDADVENGKSLVTVYPNPVGKDRIIHLQLANFATGNYHCSLYDGNGKPVLQTTIAVTGSSSAHIHIPQAAAQGLYYLKIADANGKIIRQVPVTVIY